MKFCISFGKLELKYFFYCVLYIIIEIYIDYFIYSDEEKIISVHNLFHSFCFFLGYLLNFIPAWIVHIKSKTTKKPIKNKLKEENNLSIEYIYNKPYEKYLSTKDVIIFLFVSFIPLLADIIENIGDKIEYIDYSEEKKYNDNYIFIEFFIVFLVSKIGKEVYYKHQFIPFFILILVEVIKYIYLFIEKLSIVFNPISIILNIIYCIFYAFYFLYIKKLMNNKFISPYKFNYMIGIINVPIIILTYFIISLTPYGNSNNEYYYDNIFKLFTDLGNINATNMVILISFPFIYGIYQFIVIKTIYDYSIFHMYIPFLIHYFIDNISKNIGTIAKIFLISIFLIELIMILIFLEIIEINCCGLSENLKRNIQSRGTIESALNIENEDDNEIDDEGNDESSEIKNSNF